MIQCCEDVFKTLNLPFETYFIECVSHDCCKHNDLEIIWLLKGKAVIKQNNKSHTLYSQSVFLVYMNTMHSVEIEEGSIIISYRLKNEHLTARGLYFDKIPFKEKVFSFDYLAHKYHQVPLLLTQLLKILLSGERKEIVYYKIIAFYNFYIFELYSMLIKDYALDVKTVDYKKYLNRSHTIVEYIHEHYKEKITLDQLASLTNLSTYRVAHFIKEALGISMKEFITNVRVEKAITLFKSTTLSTQEVASAVGFSDYKYFNEAMKKRYNKTPLQCRKTLIDLANTIDIDPSKRPFVSEIKQCLKLLENDQRLKHIFTLEPHY